MAYTILYRESVKREMRNLDAAMARRIDTAIQSLANNPRPSGCVKLAGVEDVWRIRVGNYRIVYEIHDQRLIVMIVTVAHRREVYRRLK